MARKLKVLSSGRGDDESDLNVAENGELRGFLYHALSSLWEGDVATMVVLDSLHLHFSSSHISLWKVKTLISWRERKKEMKVVPERRPSESLELGDRHVVALTCQKAGVLLFSSALLFGNLLYLELFDSVCNLLSFMARYLVFFFSLNNIFF